MLNEEEKRALRVTWQRAKERNDHPTMGLINIIVMLEADNRRLRYGEDWESAVRKELGIEKE